MKKAIYESPQAELFEFTLEVNLLTSYQQTKSAPDLEEEDGWGDSIWN